MTKTSLHWIEIDHYPGCWTVASAASWLENKSPCIPLLPFPYYLNLKSTIVWIRNGKVITTTTIKKRQLIKLHHPMSTHIVQTMSRPCSCKRTVLPSLLTLYAKSPQALTGVVSSSNMYERSSLFWGTSFHRSSEISAQNNTFSSCIGSVKATKVTAQLTKVRSLSETIIRPLPTPWLPTSTTKKKRRQVSLLLCNIGKD